MKVIALDVGTTSIKASLVDEHGRIRKALTSRTGKINHQRPNYMEMNPDEIFLNIIKVLKHLAIGLGHDDVLLSLSCMAPVLVFVDTQFKPLRPAILYNDLRTTEEVSLLNNKFGVDELVKINGNQANIQQWAPKLLWIRQHEPEIASRIRKLLDLSSYIIWKLTGEAVIDYTTALEGGLLDYVGRKWSNRMLSFLGIGDSLLPEPTDTLHQNEISSEGIKAKLGLAGRHVSVTSSCVDAVSTPIGMGVIEEGKLSLELGTTGIIYTPTRKPNPDRRLYLDFSPINGLYLVGGGTAASGLFYDWILQLLNGKVDYNKCENWGRLSQPGARGIVILPYILGERTPVFDMAAKGVIFGLQQKHSRGDLVRAAMEAVAYSFLHHLRIMREKGYEVTRGSITGGGAKSKLLREIMTDVLGTPMLYNRKMSTTVGTAFIGYMSAGIKTSWSQVKEWFTDSEHITPSSANRVVYDRNFAIYLNLYEKHLEDFRRI